MCRAVKCGNCGKTTWAGCGAHIESVKAGVKPENWCTCPEDKRKPEGCVIQ